MPAGHSIQTAISSAVNGDVVVVATGTYKQRIDFKGKAITVRSSNPTSPTVVAATIINGNAGGSVVTFKSGEKATSVLSGFTITNGSGTSVTLATYPSKTGGGVYCNGSSPTISGNVITANNVVGGTAVSLPFGGGIGCYNASPTVSGNTVSGNTVTTGDYVNGGGLGCWGGSPKIINNIVSGNAVYATTDHAGGGGLWCMAAAETISGNVISGNQASYCGGGLKCEQETAPATISGNTISNNTAPRGGGVYSWDATLTFTNDIVSGNSASIFGGGFKFDEGAVVTLVNCTVSGNSSAKGGGISFSDDTSLTLRNTIVAFSTAGGGLEWHGGNTSSPKAVLSYCDLYGNVGGDYGNWPNQTGKNGNLSKNPLFAWAARGNFYEKSKGGRWNPTTKAWVIDTVHSPCIDTGG
ncbi:MAG: hypothetical protein WCP21_22870, partial [Armatimonadota bacterium]